MSAVDDYQAATEALADSAAREALALYASHQSEGAPPDDTGVLIAAVVNRANASAVALADVWLAVQIEEQTGQPVPTVGVLPADDSERLVKAANTILDHFGDANEKPGQDQFRDTTKMMPFRSRRAIPDAASNSRRSDVTADQDHETGNPANNPDATKVTNAPDMRLERLARAEVFESAQRATHEAMQQQPLVEGWVRQFDANPCQLCRWWWREGRVWPKQHPMPRHKGCNCTPRVVLAQHIKSTRYTRRLRGTHE